MNNRIDLQIIFGKFFSLYNFIKWIFIILNIILLIGFIYSFYKSWQFRPKINHKKTKNKVISLRRELYRVQWFDIAIKFKEEDFNLQKMAIIEADKLVDSILKEIGVNGKHLADKLSKIHPDSLQSLNGLIENHRIRNDLLYTPGFKLSSEEIYKVFENYETFLKEIGIIIE